MRYFSETKDYILGSVSSFGQSLAEQFQDYSNSLSLLVTLHSLRRIELDKMRQANSPDYRTYHNWTQDSTDLRIITLKRVSRMMGFCPDQLAAEAAAALPCEPGELLNGDMSQWVPTPVPLLRGAYPVHVLLCVMGKVRRQTNHAWDTRFSNTEKMDADLHGNSCLFRIGMLPLVNVVRQDYHAVLSSTYCQSLLRPKTKGIDSPEAGLWVVYQMEMVLPCIDNDGSTFQALVAIYTCLMFKGAVAVRSIVLTPIPAAEAVPDISEHPPKVILTGESDKSKRSRNSVCKTEQTEQSQIKIEYKPQQSQGQSQIGYLPQQSQVNTSYVPQQSQNQFVYMHPQQSQSQMDYMYQQSLNQTNHMAQRPQQNQFHISPGSNAPSNAPTTKLSMISSTSPFRQAARNVAEDQLSSLDDELLLEFAADMLATPGATRTLQPPQVMLQPKR